MAHGRDGGSAAGNVTAAAAPETGRPGRPGRDSPGRGHDFDPSILRAYDIRGTVGRTLSGEDAFHVGRAFGTIVMRRGGETVVLGYDGRLSSPELATALGEGLARCGATVLGLGLASTPMAYFAAERLAADAAVVVTGSHNPASHNGFKLVLGGAPFFGEDIAGLGRMAALGDYQTGSGRIETRAVIGDYIERLRAELPSGRDLTVASDPGRDLAVASDPGRDLTVAWDPGNGAAGPVTEALAGVLPGRHVVINQAVDGTFPAHHPDPSRRENLQQLADVVAAEGCDLGIAFDGDGDRVGVIDRGGRMIDPEKLLMLFAGSVLESNPGAAVISEVKASQGLFDLIATLGGRPLMSPTGHSPIKAMMRRSGALLAGDVSGHFYFADRYGGYDDGAYAAVRLLDLVARNGGDLAAMVDALPASTATPEIRFTCPDTRKFEIVEHIARRLEIAGAEVVDIDGVRVSIGGGNWWLLRASNTEAALTARCEGRDRLGLDQAKHALVAALRDAGLKIDPAALFPVTA